MQYYRSNLTSDKWRGITWSDFLVMLLLIQPRLLLAFISCSAHFVHAWPLSPRICKSFSAEQFLSQSASVWGKQHVLLPMFLLNYTTFLLVHSLSLSGLFWMAVLTSRLKSFTDFNDVHDQELDKMWRHWIDFRTDTHDIIIWKPVELPTHYYFPSWNI